MTQDNIPDDLPEGDEPMFNPFEVLVGRGHNEQPNPKPDTAQGVADLLATTRKHVEENAFARVSVVYGDNGRFAELTYHTDGRTAFTPQDVIDAQSDRPRFRKGTAVMTSLDSFIAHINRFGDGDSAVFANDDRSSPSLLAVLNYHRKDTLASEGDEEPSGWVHGEYRHANHRTSFSFPLSDEWQAWHDRNACPMSMADFAMFLENNVLDIAEIEKVPAGYERFVEQNGGPNLIADWQMLTKLARGLRIDENSVVSEAVTLNSGEGELTISNAHDTEVGGVKVKVPTMFFVEIPIFREGAFYRVPVRLRYRKDRGGVVFWYELWRSDRAFTHAFNEAVDRVRGETMAEVFFGRPEA